MGRIRPAMFFFNSRETKNVPGPEFLTAPAMPRLLRPPPLPPSLRKCSYLQRLLMPDDYGLVCYFCILVSLPQTSTMMTTGVVPAFLPREGPGYKLFQFKRQIRQKTKTRRLINSCPRSRSLCVAGTWPWCPGCCPRRRRASAADKELGNCAAQQSKYNRLYLYSGKATLAAMYLRRVQNVGRSFMAALAYLITASASIISATATSRLKKSRRRLRLGRLSGHAGSSAGIVGSHSLLGHRRLFSAPKKRGSTILMSNELKLSLLTRHA